MNKNEVILLICSKLKEKNIKFQIQKQNGIDIFLVNNELKYFIFLSDSKLDLFDVLHQIPDYEYIFEIDQNFLKNVILFSVNGFENTTKELLNHFFVTQDIKDLESFLEKI